MIELMETDKQFGLYVHIPFCVSKCTYCDFASVRKNNDLIENYTDALCKEIEMHKAKFSDSVFDTIFIGGGTPSCIPYSSLERIIKSVYSNLNTELKEFTIEINPGTGSKSMFEMLKNLGVNRVSVGLQCADNEILKSIGRIHDVKQFEDTVNKIKNAGIQNFNTDIISGLPNQTADILISSINLAYNLGAKHISMYTLKLEEGTPLYSAVNKGKVALPSPEEESKMSAYARNYLENLNYQRYEISNYSKRGFACIHNLKYWEREPYLGVGTAAASMFHDTRYVNTSHIPEYIASVNKGKLPLASIETLSKNDIAFEMIMLSTRLSAGLSYKKYNEFTGEDFTKKYSDILSELQNENLIKKDHANLILTTKGLDIQNQILLRFMD